MKGIIVSGTARSGKSFLVKNIKENKHLITYKVDLLLIQSLRYKRPKNSITENKRKIVVFLGTTIFFNE